MDRQGLVRTHALGRAALGAALVCAPGRLGRPWLGPLGDRSGTKVAVAALGARDVAIGLGTSWAAGAGTGARPWLLAGVLADMVDLVATVRARDTLPALGVFGVGTLAAGSAALGGWLALGAD